MASFSGLTLFNNIFICACFVEGSLLGTRLVNFENSASYVYYCGSFKANKVSIVGCDFFTCKTGEHIGILRAVCDLKRFGCGLEMAAMLKLDTIFLRSLILTACAV